MILPVRHDQIQDGCQIDPHGTLFRHFNIYNFLLDNICFQKKLVSLNIPGGAREAPLSTRLKMAENYLKNVKVCVIFCFHPNNIFWARLFQNIYFLHYSARFFKYFWLF